MSKKTVSQMVVDSIASPEAREKSAREHSHYVKPTPQPTTQPKAKQAKADDSLTKQLFEGMGYPGVTSFAELEELKAMQAEVERMAALNSELGEILTNILNDPDLDIPAKKAAMERTTQEYTARVSGKPTKQKAIVHDAGLTQDAVSLLFGPGAMRTSLKARWAAEDAAQQAEGERAHEDFLASLLSRGMIR